MYSRFAWHYYPTAVMYCRSAHGVKFSGEAQGVLTNLTFSSQQSNALRLCSSTRQSRAFGSDPPSEPNVIDIYNGSMTKKVMRVKLLSFTTSACGLGLGPIIYEQVNNSLPGIIAASSLFGFFTFVTPLLLHILAKRYVMKVSYDKEKDSYCAHLMTFFCLSREVHFQPGEAKIPPSGGMLTSMEVRGIPMMIEFSAVDPDHLKRLLGYDKPLDIRHESIAEDSGAEKKREK